jgi:hypothetical protein
LMSNPGRNLQPANLDYTNMVTCSHLALALTCDSGKALS